MDLERERTMQTWEREGGQKARREGVWNLESAQCSTRRGFMVQA